MPGSMRQDPVATLADFVGGLAEGHGQGSGVGGMGKQLMVAVPILHGALSDNTTYSRAAFACPCDGVYVKRAYLAAMTAPGGGTNKVNLYAYDGSDNQLLDSADYDPTNLTSKEPSKLTLSTTKADRLLSEGDFVWIKWEAGSQSTDAKDPTLVLLLIVPEVVAD